MAEDILRKVSFLHRSMKFFIMGSMMIYLSSFETSDLKQQSIFWCKVCMQFYFKPKLYTQYNRGELGPRPMMNALLVYTGLLLGPDEWPVVRADVQRCWTITLITQSSHTWHYATHVLRALPSARANGRQKRWTLWEDIHQGYCKGSPCWSQKQVWRKALVAFDFLCKVKRLFQTII